jgi:hypothetical protein
VGSDYFKAGGSYYGPYYINESKWDRGSGLVYRVGLLFTFVGGEGDINLYI